MIPTFVLARTAKPVVGFVPCLHVAGCGMTKRSQRYSHNMPARRVYTALTAEDIAAGNFPRPLRLHSCLNGLLKRGETDAVEDKPGRVI